MTNLSTTSRQPWLTRGRLLVGLPLGLGALVSFGLMTVGVRPLLQTVQGLEERRDTLLSLQRSAPALERQLNQAETELQMAEETQDPLQALGYRKSSVALEVSGSFGGLQTFLQRMEALELWVESSELALKAVVEKQNAESIQSVVAPTQLTLKLSFYDMASVLDVPSNGSDSSPS